MSPPSARFRIKVIAVVALTLLIAGALIATGPDEDPPVSGLRNAAGLR